MHPDFAAATGFELVVHDRKTAAEGVVLLSLCDPHGATLPPWEPGAHVDLVLTPDRVRQYSLCGDPDDRSTYQIGVLREPRGRGGSLHVHDRLALGATVHVRGPRNHFPLLPSPRYLFIAGGIGITPLVPMLAAAHRAGSDWQLHYGGRSRSSMAFANELQTRYPDRVTVTPQDNSGLLDLAKILGDPAQNVLVYCCGPEPLLTAVESHCGSSWRPNALHLERFVPRPVGEPILQGTFQVVLALSGKTIRAACPRLVLKL